MAQLNFPENPLNGQLYPNPCPAGVTQYSWDSSTGMWRIVGVATGVTPGLYGNDLTVGQFTVDVSGNITNANNVPIRSASVLSRGVVQLNDTTTSSRLDEALTAKAGKNLQDQIGNLVECIVPSRNNVVAALNDLQLQSNKQASDALTWCGYYNAQEGDISYVSITGARAGYIIGQELPTPSQQNGGDFFIVTQAGNPYIAGDFNAPDINMTVGSWIVSEVQRWSYVDAQGGAVKAIDVSFVPTAPLTSLNVQNALTQLTSLLRTPVGGATISNERPASPYPGQLWWDDDYGTFYIFYRDLNSSQWVEVGGGGSQALGGGGSGTVYEIRTGVGLTGGPINTEGTISLVSAGVTNATIGGVYIPPNKGLSLLQDGNLTLTPASTSILGGIIVGDNLTITAEGVLSATGGGGGTADLITIRPIPGISSATNVQEGLEAIELQVQDRIEFVQVLDLGITATVTSPVLTSNDGTTLQITPLRAGINGAFGVVSLTNDLTGNSQTLAITQFAGNTLQRQISALVGVNVLAGTYNAILGVMVYVTPAGLANGFVVGQNCPPPATSIDNYYVIVTIGGNVAPPTAPAQFAGAGDWYICQAEVGTTPVWFLIDFENITVAAANVTLAAIPGLSATNVQTGIEQVQANTLSRTGTISSTVGLSVAYQPNKDVRLNLLVANSTDLGGVYVVPNRGINLGSDGALTLLPPTQDKLQIGGVKAGTNITIDAEGVISASGGGGGGTAADIQVTPVIPGIEFAANVQRALEAIETQVQDRVEFVKAGTVGLSIVVSNPVPLSNDGTTATISLDFSSTGQRGIVQLTNDITGKSEQIAPTQLAISLLNSKVDALVGANVLAGTYNSNTGTVSTVTPAGKAANFIVGQQAPQAKNVPDNYYLIVTIAGGLGPPGATIPPAGVQSGDWFIAETENAVSSWITIDYENRAVAAVQVVLAPVPGITATNVQTGFEQIQLELDSAINSVTSTNNGITAVTFPTPSKTGNSVTVELNPATKFDIGGVFVADNQGLILTQAGGLSLAPPTNNAIGGVKAGTNITIDPDGTINSSGGGGGGGTAKDITVSPLIPGIEFATNVQRALEAIEIQVQDRVEFINAGTVGLSVVVTPPVATSNDGTTATISLDFSSTSQRGIVQLTNDITGNSQQIAPTQLAVSLLNSKVDALVGANVLAGTYNSNTGTVSTVTPAGRAAGFVVGAQAPPAANVPDNYYLIVVVSGNSGPPGAIIPPAGVQSGDWFIAEKETAGAIWVTIDYENRAVAAVQVILAPVPGITATNVQAGFEQIQLELDAAINSVTSLNNGITAVTFPTPSSTGESVTVKLNPATKFDIGGVFVADNQGLILTTAGGLSLAPPTGGVIGGVKAGTNITIAADGTISSSGGGGGGVTQIKAGTGVTIDPPSGVGVVTINASSGPTPSPVNIVLIDSIASQFNGTSASFILKTGGVNLDPTINDLALLIELGGALQAPLLAYSYNSTTATITFTSAPPTGTSFSGRAFVGLVPPAIGPAVSAVGVSIVSIDSIASQFNGTLTSFNLAVGTVALGNKAQQQDIILEVGGILQAPGLAYTYDQTTSRVSFTGAPPAGATFSARAFLGLVQ